MQNQPADDVQLSPGIRRCAWVPVVLNGQMEDELLIKISSRTDSGSLRGASLEEAPTVSKVLFRVMRSMKNARRVSTSKCCTISKNQHSF